MISLALAVALPACERSQQVGTDRDAGSSTLAAKDALCWQQSDGCVWCVGREGEASFLEAEQSRPWVCDPKDSENCVEFCSVLTADCALPWVKGPGCVFDSEVAFRRALFRREAAGRTEGTVSGRIVDEAGKQVKGARIRVWLSWRNQLTHLGDETASRDGTFRLRLATGPWTYALRISHPGRASDIVERLALDKTPGAPRTFKLGPEHMVKGRVVDATSGAPVVGAHVVALRSTTDAIEASEIDSVEDGAFTLGGLEVRRYVLRVTKFGWRPGGLRMPQPSPGPRITVKLKRANVIRGVVSNSAGEPEPNATVAAVLSGVPGGPALPYTWTTDSDGKFQQDRFAPGTYYLWARRGDMLVFPPEKIELGENQEVEVALALKHKGARISGQVQPSVGYRLGPETRVVLLSRSPLAFPRPAVGELQRDGQFVVAGVLPGRYDVSVRDGGRMLAVVKGPREVEVPIEPDSAVVLKNPLVVRPQISE